MRDEALEPADLYDPGLKVVDVGGGTGFTTLGIVKHVYPKNVTILDQSPHQLAKARQKEELKECTIIEGDAEELPFPTDSVDRYISAGSIEYWPDPQRGIREAYRVLKLGGLACVIELDRNGTAVSVVMASSCSVTGAKRESGDSPLQLGPKAEDVKKPVNPFSFLIRFILGTIAATYYVYMWIKDQIVPKGQPI
uniref:MPBQ/MBSQ family SAM-binding methyltransferase profile domain-containing protein n=2 Tax=Musa acuminata subsp. malaccensis TaxID=214687 RepID=A0A804IXC2_MUSAM